MPPLALRKPLKFIKDETQFYQHQADGVRELWRRQSWLLADDMGLGKSLQALTVAAIDYEREHRRTLIVCPASLKWNWADEIDKYTKFSYTILSKATGPARSKQIQEYLASGKDILIINYEQVQAHLEELNAIRFHIAIADEAHYIKGPESQRTVSFQGVRANRFFLLTGSPILNQVDDLWSLLYRIDPKMFPHYYKFTGRYAVFGGYKGKQVIGVKHERELHKKLASVMLRREKKDVLDLPDKLYIPLTVELHPAQRKLYDQAKKELLIDLPDPTAEPMEIKNGLSKALRLKQICGTTATIEGHPDNSTKLDLATERALEIIAMGESVVIFTQFLAVQEAIVNRIKMASKGKCQPYVLNGAVPPDKRVDLVKTWSAAKPAVLVAMLQVAGVGLNMTAANKCIFLDKLYTPKLNEQAEDRLHRIGADESQPVEIITIQCRDTIEQRIEQILRRKEKIFGTVVNDDDFNRKLIEALYEEEAA